MHDIRFIRENPADFDAGMKRRGLAPQAAAILALDEQRRAVQTALQDAQKKRNDASKLVGNAKGSGDDAEATRLMGEVADLKTQIQDNETRDRTLGEELHTLLAGLPNIPAADVPDGLSEDDNVELRRWGNKPAFDFAPKDHVELGEALGLMDFEAAARMSGARFVVLKGVLARLERALGQFMLDIQTGENGYTEISPPLLVRDEAAFGVGQLPKFADDLFRTTNDLWLISTSEVPLSNLVREQIVDQADLPIRVTALTPCFRSEAGAAGKDTRGMIRQHQFHKVEIVSIVASQTASDEHERLTNSAEEVLKRLDLHYRVVVLCTGDLGFSNAKTYDIEVWLPGQDSFREISSCSHYTDFQARRMNARYRAAGEKGTHFVHTLNGSGLAVGRTLVAVLENYQQADGSIIVPDVLRPYMRGVEVIGP
ncbi:MAG: serine--tRNA ligase [Proteobacteria bacterium]|nr:serine--tRNA ligase [Pseudomonadota bacterium]MDA1057304.1 serine--tRNA ligase [Pseudomonadota bacterium]